MATAEGAVSFRIPTSALFRAAGYTTSQSKSLPKIWGKLASAGRCSTSDIARTIKKSPGETAEILDVASEREHVIGKRIGREWIWSTGPKFASLTAPKAERMAAASRRTERKTLLQTFYDRKVRRKFAKRYSHGHMLTLDVVMRAVGRWRESIFLEDVDAKWFKDFDLHMKTKGLSDGTRRNRLVYLNYIVREKYPYRVLTGRSRWSTLAPILIAERAGFFGNYYATVYEKKVERTESMMWFDRGVVKRFARWRDSPTELEVIDNRLLKQFEKSEIERGLEPHTAAVFAAVIRRVVNHWHPDRLPTIKQPSPPPASEGMVQHFIEQQCTSDNEKHKTTIQGYRRLNRDLHEFRSGQELPFSDFTPELCNEFMKWCAKDRTTGKPLSLESVNSHVRSFLIQISIAATSAGLMKKRLFLEPVGDWKPRRPTVAYRRKSDSPAKRAARSKGGQATRKWTPRVNALAIRFSEELGSVNSHRARCSRVAAKLMAEGHEFSVKTVERYLPKVGQRL